VFNVAWSPLLPDMLMSGSDDRTARVWRVSNKECQVLQGHVSNVRGLLWHSEIPFLVVTGSWDATIRMWDVRTASCLKVREIADWPCCGSNGSITETTYATAQMNHTTHVSKKGCGKIQDQLESQLLPVRFLLLHVLSKQATWLGSMFDMRAVILTHPRVSAMYA